MYRGPHRKNGFAAKCATLFKHSIYKIKINVRECSYKRLLDPSFLPELDPCDFHLFSRLRKHLRGLRFSENDIMS